MVMPPLTLLKRRTMRPSATARTGVPRGAMMSMALWTRPSERASLYVSLSCSGRTPATGINSRDASPEALGVEGASVDGCCVVGVAPGVGVAVGGASMFGRAVGSTVGVAEGEGGGCVSASREGGASGETGCVQYLVLKYQTSAASAPKPTAAIRSTRTRG